MNYAEILREFGFKDGSGGFYIAQAMLKKMEGKRLPVVLGDLYIDIAAEVNKTPGRKVKYTSIERTIRISIEVAYEANEPNLTQKYWRTIPCVKEFIHRVFTEAEIRNRVVA